jgi:TRAP-type C4-dicarboxylate transport system substrate-binding protein
MDALMKRLDMRLFVLMILAMALFVLLGSAQAQTKGQIKWKVSIFGPPRAWTHPVAEWAEVMKKETNGRWVIELYYGETLGPAAEQLDGIRSGLFEAAAVTVFYSPGKIPLNQVLDLPFLPPLGNRNGVRLQMAAWEHPALLAELERWNAVPLIPTCAPQFELMGRKRIAKAEDFKGLRISGMSADQGRCFAKFGAVPTPMPAPEVSGAVDRGTIDVVCWPYAYGFGAFGVYEHSKYVTLDFAAGTGTSFYVANKKAWDALPEDIKEKHRNYMKNWPEHSARHFGIADEKWVPIYKAKGMEFIRFPKEERAKFVEAARPIWDEWAKEWEKRGPTREILDYILKKRKEISGQ